MFARSRAEEGTEGAEAGTEGGASARQEEDLKPIIVKKQSQSPPAYGAALDRQQQQRKRQADELEQPEADPGIHASQRRRVSEQETPPAPAAPLALQQQHTHAMPEANSDIQPLLLSLLYDFFLGRRRICSTRCKQLCAALAWRSQLRLALDCLTRKRNAAVFFESSERSQASWAHSLRAAVQNSQLYCKPESIWLGPAHIITRARGPPGPALSIPRSAGPCRADAGPWICEGPHARIGPRDRAQLGVCGRSHAGKPEERCARGSSVWAKHVRASV